MHQDTGWFIVDYPAECGAMASPCRRCAACCGAVTGTVLFKINGKPTSGMSVPVRITAPATARTITALIRLDDTTIPNGAGSYPITATFTSSNPNYGNAGGSATATVNPEGGATITYTCGCTPPGR
jgi:hypothetical protein